MYNERMNFHLSAPEKNEKKLPPIFAVQRTCTTHTQNFQKSIHGVFAANNTTPHHDNIATTTIY